MIGISKDFTPLISFVSLIPEAIIWGASKKIFSFISYPTASVKDFLINELSFNEDIIDIGNNSWPALIIGVVIAVIIERYIMNPLKVENKKIERQTSSLKDTLKDGNGIDKDYCKYLLELERLDPR